MAKIAVYPGSFDPITNGHLDIIKRAARLCDKLVVAVLINDKKEGMFSLEERMDILQNAVGELDCDNIVIDSFSGLLVDYCKENNIQAIVRGLRAISDFEFEMQMAQMNRKLYEETETIFLTTSTHYSYISSSIVKEVARFNGNISELVPEYVIIKIKEKLNRGK